MKCRVYLLWLQAGCEPSLVGCFETLGGAQTFLESNPPTEEDSKLGCHTMIVEECAMGVQPPDELEFESYGQPVIQRRWWYEATETCFDGTGYRCCWHRPRWNTASLLPHWRPGKNILGECQRHGHNPARPESDEEEE